MNKKVGLLVRVTVCVCCYGAVSIRFNGSFHCNGSSQPGCRTNLVGNISYFKQKKVVQFPPHTQGAA